MVAGPIQDAQREITIGTAAAATEGIFVAERTGHPVAGLPVGCEVPVADGGGSEDKAWVIFVDDAISVEVQWLRMDSGASELSSFGGRCPL